MTQLLRSVNSAVRSYLANECEGEDSECLHSLSSHAGFGWQQAPESWVHCSFGQSLPVASTNWGSYYWPPMIQVIVSLSHHISKMQARQLSQCMGSTSCEVSASMTDSWMSLDPYLRSLRSFAALEWTSAAIPTRLASALAYLWHALESHFLAQHFIWDRVHMAEGLLRSLLLWAWLTQLPSRMESLRPPSTINLWSYSTLLSQLMPAGCWTRSP